MALQVLSIIYLTSISHKAFTTYKRVLEDADVGYVVLGGGGNPWNTTDLPHPYIRILNGAVELTSECFITVLFRPQSVMLFVELHVVVLLFMSRHHLMSRSNVI